MIYTKSMYDLLFFVGEEGRTVFAYYLDRYYDELKEPEFHSYELSKIWYLLLTRGLLAEIKEKGKHQKLALTQLKKLVDMNSAFYNNNNVKLRTIEAIMKEREKSKEYREGLKDASI